MKESADFKDEKDARLKADLSGKKISGLQRLGIYVAALFVAFLLGFVPMWLAKRSAAIERDGAQRELRVARLQNNLANAIVNARAGEYEPARLAASNFFTDLRAEIDRREEGAFGARQNEPLEQILSQRDDVITLLARSDQAAVERLANLYLAYVKAASQTAPETE